MYYNVVYDKHTKLRESMSTIITSLTPKNVNQHSSPVFHCTWVPLPLFSRGDVTGKHCYSQNHLDLLGTSNCALVALNSHRNFRNIMSENEESDCCIFFLQSLKK